MKTLILKKYLVSSLALAAFTLATSACSKNSSPFNWQKDPTGKYKDLSGYVPPHTNPDLGQDLSLCPLAYSFRIEDQQQRHPLEFEAGAQKSYKLFIKTAPNVGSYSLNVQNFPANATLKRNSLNEWTITWTPPINLIPTYAGYWMQDASVIINAPAASATCSSSAMTQSLTFLVGRANAKPSISSTFNENTVFNSTDKVKFDVTVVDPAATDALIPELNITFDASNLTAEQETLRADDAVQCGGGQKIKEQTWKYSCTFDASTVAKKKDGQDGGIIQSKFNMFAVSSVNKFQSADLAQIVRIALPVKESATLMSPAQESAKAANADAKAVNTGDSKIPIPTPRPDPATLFKSVSDQNSDAIRDSKGNIPVPTPRPESPTEMASKKVSGGNS